MIIPCPKGYVPTVEVCMDHCILASDDPEDIFACHDKRCKYNRPVSRQEWDRLVKLEYSSLISVARRIW